MVQHVATYAATERALATAIARRTSGRGPEPALLAAVFLTTPRVVTQQRLELPEPSLRELVREAMRRVGERFR